MFTFANPWVILGGVLLVIGIAAGSYSYGHSVGADATNVKWQARELKVAAVSAAALKAAQDHVIETERLGAAMLNTVSAGYQQKLKRIDYEKSAFVAAATAGGLFVNTVSSTPVASPVPATGTGPSRCDGPSRARLSDEAVEFFVGEASRADKIAEQLAACQAVVQADREK